MIADGGDALTHLAVLRDQAKLFGAVAREPTAWRAVERVDEDHLARLRAVRAAARERAWAAGAGPDVAAGLTIDLDATIIVAHSEKQNAAATWKKTYGLLPACLDRPDVSGGEALAGVLRPGNAGSNTAADHVGVLDMALAVLPQTARPRPSDPGSPAVLVRTDAAGATSVFAAALRERGCGFSLGFAIDEQVQDAIGRVPARAWTPAYDICLPGAAVHRWRPSGAAGGGDHGDGMWLDAALRPRQSAQRKARSGVRPERRVVAM